MRDVFKNNNALLRGEIRAMKGDIAREFTQHFENYADNIANNLADQVRENQSDTNKKTDELEKNINTLAEEHKNDWDKLVKWDIPDQYEKVRQDVIPNGIVSQYTYGQLSESSGATFNSPKFYG